MTAATPDPIDELLAEADAMIKATPSPTTASTVAHSEPLPTWWSTGNAMTMSAIILAFGVVVLGLAAWLVKSGQSATAVLRVFGTVLIIVMVTFLVVAGYDDKQIAAPLGLLGTIAGYLLGRDAKAAAEKE